MCERCLEPSSTDNGPLVPKGRKGIRRMVFPVKPELIFIDNIVDDQVIPSWGWRKPVSNGSVDDWSWDANDMMVWPEATA